MTPSSVAIDWRQTAGTPTLAGAIAEATSRGWRLDKPERGAQIDAVVALAMAVERADQPAAPACLLGWV